MTLREPPTRAPTALDRRQHARSFEQTRLELFRLHGFEGASHRVPDRAGRLVYVIRGGDGTDRPPVVLVHGGLSEASEWSLLAGRLPGNLVIPDRPGCGLSYPIDYRGSDYRASAAQWFVDLLDGIGAADPVDVVANSMGGFFSMAFAAAHPDRVRRLVLVGAPAGVDRSLPLFIRLWGNRITGPVITRNRITEPEALRERVFATLLVARPETVPKELLEVMVAAAALPGVGSAAYSMLRTVTTWRGWRSELLMRDTMAGLRVPTLFLWGDRDAFAPPSSGIQLAARMPDARVEVLADTGHLPHVDRPDEVAWRVARFLDTPDR